MLEVTGFALSVIPWVAFGAMLAASTGLGSLFGATCAVLCVALPPIAMIVWAVGCIRKGWPDLLLSGLLLSGVAVLLFSGAAVNAILYFLD